MEIEKKSKKIESDYIVCGTRFSKEDYEKLFTKKDYYIYKEYDSMFGGYKERVNITKVFESIEELFEYMQKRKEFYKSNCNTKTIKIDIIKRGV